MRYTKKKPYALNGFDAQILEEICNREFCTIDQLHSSFSSSPLVTLMRAVHNLTRHGYLQQQRLTESTFYFLKSKAERMEAALRNDHSQEQESA